MALLLSAMHTFVSPRACRELEGMPNDPVHALVRIQLFLNRDFIVCAGLEAPADADIEPLGVLTKDDKVDIVWPAFLERTQTRVEQPHRAIVDEEVELEARAEEDVTRVAIVGDAGIAKRADEDRVEAAQQVVAVRLGS